MPAEEEPALANVIKVVHFGWHHVSTTHGEPPGWKGHIKNKVGWGWEGWGLSAQHRVESSCHILC